MKEQYEVPVLEVIGFESEDVITTSGVGNTGKPDMGDGNEGNVDFENF